MKKKTKIILFSALGVVGLTVAALGTAIIVDCSTGGLGGTIVKDVTPGYGQDEWRQYDVDLEIREKLNDKLYTNEPGDYISGIMLTWDTPSRLRIEYNNYFNIADDFDAFFVLKSTLEGVETKYYRTPVETTHWLYGDYIHIPCQNLDSTFDYNASEADRDYSLIKSYHIVEVWIRTVD